MIFNHFFLKFRLQKIFLGTFLAVSSILPVNAQSVQITSFGHGSLLVKGGGHSILLNPFKAVGCAEGLREPDVQADVILASSELPDEGNRNLKGIFMVQPGSYQIGKLTFEGFSAPHDRVGGRRYGLTTAWQWIQGGINFVHLGGSATPPRFQDKLLFGQPDVLVIAVGGGSKVYTGEEAAAVVKYLEPKIVIPVQYVRGSKSSSCDQTTITPFLNAMEGVEVKDVGKTFTVRKVPNELRIHLMR